MNKKNIINTNDLKIRLCTSEDVKDIYELQNIVIEYFKENEKGYFLPFKEESYLRIVNDPINDGEIYGAFLKDKMIAWIFLSVSNINPILLKHFFISLFKSGFLLCSLSQVKILP